MYLNFPGARAIRFAAVAGLACLPLISLVEIWDGQPRNAPARRYGQYHLLQGDLHTHSFIASAFPMPWEIVWQAEYQQLDFVAITEHNSTVGAFLGEEFARRFSPVIVIPGEELTTPQHHLILLGLKKTVPAGWGLAAIEAEVRRQNALLVAAHPVRQFWPSYDRILDTLDGIEAVTPATRMQLVKNYPLFTGRIADTLRRQLTLDYEKDMADGGANTRWNWRDTPHYYDKAVAERARSGRTLAALGSSDYHGFAGLGYVRTVAFARERSRAGIEEAIRSGRTVAWAGGDAFIGPEPLLADLRDAGFVMPPGDFDYRAHWLSRVLTLIAFICLGTVIAGQGRFLALTDKSTITK